MLLKFVRLVADMPGWYSSAGLLWAFVDTAQALEVSGSPCRVVCSRKIENYLIRDLLLSAAVLEVDGPIIPLVP